LQCRARGAGAEIERGLVRRAAVADAGACHLEQRPRPPHEERQIGGGHRILAGGHDAVDDHVVGDDVAGQHALEGSESHPLVP
jgi:hypothetical protein